MSSRHPIFVRRNACLKCQSTNLLSVAYIQEIQGNLLVETNQDPPSQILHHISVFVLTRTIVSMQMEIGLAKIVRAEKMVQHADDAVSSFSSVYCLINQVIDLLKGLYSIQYC